MPTGYTAAIAGGITFREYALGCARAFGALIMMRDEPQDAPIPERFEPSDWHADELQNASERLVRLRLMSPAEAAVAAKQEYDEAVAHDNKYAQERAALRAKYEAMLGQVLAWQPPTPDHVELKTFMEQQLRESITWDCTHFGDGPQRMTGKEWLDKAIAKAQYDIEYHTRQHAEEIERVRGRNAWIKALRESLPS